MYLIGVYKKEDEEDQFRQEDDQQNDEELKGRDCQKNILPNWPADAFWVLRYTHTQKKAFVLLDGTQTTQETRYHDDRAQGDDEVCGGQRGEGGGQGGEAALRNWQPHADPQESTAPQLEHKRTVEFTTHRDSLMLLINGVR